MAIIHHDSIAIPVLWKLYVKDSGGLIGDSNVQILNAKLVSLAISVVKYPYFSIARLFTRIVLFS